MINPDELIKGQTYFFVLFYDENGSIPVIKTFIYIGKNIFNNKAGNNLEDEWYFQDPDSFLNHGSLETMSQDMKEKVKPTFDSLDEGSLFSVYNLTGLIDELREVKERNRSNNC